MDEKNKRHWRHVYKNPNPNPKWYMITSGNNVVVVVVISSKTNHRQGEGGQYADLLNRIRKGKHTDMDITLLKSWIHARNSPDLPENVLLIAATNKVVSTFSTALN